VGVEHLPASVSYLDAFHRHIEGGGVVLDWPDLPDLQGWTWTVSRDEELYWRNWRLRTVVLPRRVEKDPEVELLPKSEDSSGSPPSSAAATVDSLQLPRMVPPADGFSVN
jgi:hypothetical protein